MEDSSLRHYLALLNEDTLLTRGQEQALLLKIDELQDEVLHSCVGVSLFREVMYNYLRNQQYGGKKIIQISRKLNDQTDSAVLREYRDRYREILKYLKENNRAKVRRRIKNMYFSTNHVYNLIKAVKDRYELVTEGHRELSRQCRFFEVDESKGLKRLSAVADSLRTDVEFRMDLSRKLMTSPDKLMTRSFEVEELIERVGREDLDPNDFKALQETYQRISAVELEMKKYRDELIQRNLRLVVSRAKIFMNRGLDLEDLIQEGNMGLIRAINRHDTSHKVRVSTHATWWIDQAIRRAISNKSRTVRIPTHIETMQSSIMATSHELSRELNRQPTLEEIAEANKDYSLDQIQNLNKVAIHHVSMSEQIGEDMTLLDVLPSDKSTDPETVTKQKLLKERVRDVLGSLNPRTEKIIRLRFGIGEPHEELTLQSIADELGISKERVRVIQREAMSKMKRKGAFHD